MNIILYTPILSLSDRWYNVLSQKASVYQTESLRDLDSLLEGVQFDLLLLHDRDISFDQVADLRRRFPASKIFILSDRPDDEKGLAFLQLGVVGFSNSYMSAERLVAAVEVIVSGSVWMNQKLMQRLILASGGAGQQKATDEKKNALLEILSNREFQIAQLVAQGFSNMEVANELGITERTVKAHMSAIFSKTGVRGRLNLALLVNKGATAVG